MHGPNSEDEEGIASINIIPLVDVLLVVLIIFMITTVFSRETALKLDLPKGSRASESSQPPAEITVSISKDAKVFVNGQPTDVKDLFNKVQSLSSTSHKSIVVLRGDKNAIYGSIMPVLDELSRTGIQLTLALEPAKTGN